MQKCGIEESIEKACEPSTRMICLGILFDTVSMTLEITPERLNEIRSLVALWLQKTLATKKEITIFIREIEFCQCMCLDPAEYLFLDC